mmetsp:Transcript_24023/g.51004  ORF Transcript_24023/g.51004 Transcript_24023/m.51004 type:complete len:230 (+) Transcript_24023:3332-4021(+)
MMTTTTIEPIDKVTTLRIPNTKHIMIPAPISLPSMPRVTASTGIMVIPLAKQAGICIMLVLMSLVTTCVKLYLTGAIPLSWIGSGVSSNSMSSFCKLPVSLPLSFFFFTFSLGAPSGPAPLTCAAISGVIPGGTSVSTSRPGCSVVSSMGASSEALQTGSLCAFSKIAIDNPPVRRMLMRPVSMTVIESEKATAKGKPVKSIIIPMLGPISSSGVTTSPILRRLYNSLM